MADDVLRHPGDDQASGVIRRRPEDEIAEELAVNRKQELQEQEPGGAEGGDESPSADKLPGAPADDEAPLGDTDQHSDADNLPSHREQRNRDQ